MRWSAARLVVVWRKPVGEGGFSGLVYASRSFPAESPDFARSLGLSGRSDPWQPAAQGGPALLADSAGRVLVAARRGSVPATAPAHREFAFVLLLVVAALAAGRVRDPLRVGAALAIAFLATEARFGASLPLDPAAVVTLAIGWAVLPIAFPPLTGASFGAEKGRGAVAGYGLLALALFCAGRLETPDLGARLSESLAAVPRVAGLTALFFSGLSLAALKRENPGRRRAWTTAAVLFSAGALTLSLATVSASPLYRLAVFAAVAVAFELWCRAVGEARGREGFGEPRLVLGAALVVVLAAAPLREQDRAREAYRVAHAIRLPDPQRVSAGAVLAAERAVDRVSRIDLARELPAPLAVTDLSDLAYRLWREGEERSTQPPLMTYEVFDSAGARRSRFSLIPETEAAASDAQPAEARIDRHRVAILRRVAALASGGAPWGTVEVEVADWPTWDPLPPRIEVYRRLVVGAAGAAPEESRRGARPFLASYAPDGSPREEGPPLPAFAFEALRRGAAWVPVRLAVRESELFGEVRSMPEGFRLVAVPVPDLLGRALTAALLVPGIVALFLLVAALAIWRFAATPRSLAPALLPRGLQTFRSRLVGLFVVGVMIPLLAVTFFLRSAIETRSIEDTLDHARTALETARRVLDDYLPSATAGRGRLGLLDDSLLGWLANAVSFDLSVYAPDGVLVATSRRDLYDAGLLPGRVPASTYRAIGLSGARREVGVRLVAGRRFEEMTTALTALPGVPGVRSPGLLSLLLLPQQRVAEAEAAQLTAAVSAFSLLVFLFSAAVAGRLALRVARPVADLVEGTRAVARGNFSPHIEEPPDEELRELVRAFLSMSRSLKEQTDALSRETERLATLLAHLTAGVVAYRADGAVLLANPA
ncbi:MAG: HAMP domain-containing protein, partial [Acidobacteriota bacterium]